jgi:hypothetical protein
MERACVTLQAQPDSKQFTFDFVADEEVTQAQLFTVIGKPICSSCLAGYNSTIFAYGQTGAGKTHTILGDVSMEGDKEQRGILPRCFESLFKSVEQSRSTECIIKCSFLEIYQEQIFDLLDDSRSLKPLHLREDFKLGVYVEDLTELPVNSAEETYDILRRGTKNRHMGATLMNKESSRSHAVFTLKIDSRQVENSSVSLRSSRFHLIDLAGSERQRDTEASGMRLKEAGMINKSLSALGNVINGLVLASEGKPRHIHYRDSKLTFLLKDSLGGNSKTCIIANISPAATSYAETLSTLKFAQRAKLIRNKAVVNEICSDKTAQLTSQIARLRAEIEDIKLSCPNCHGMPQQSSAFAQLNLCDQPSDDGPESVLQTLKLKCRSMTEQAAEGCMKLCYEGGKGDPALPFEFIAADLGKAQLEGLKKCYAAQLEALKQLRSAQDGQELADASSLVEQTFVELQQQQAELQYNLAEKGLELEEARLDQARLQQAYEELAAEQAASSHSRPKDELELSMRQVIADATEIDQMEVQLMQAEARQTELETELLEIKDQLENALIAKDYFESQVQARQGGASPALREEIEKLHGTADAAQRQLEAEKSSSQTLFTEYCKVLEELGQVSKKDRSDDASAKLGEMQGDLSRLQDELVELKASNTDLQDELVELKASNTDMQDELVELKASNTDLQNELVDLKTSNTDLQDEVIELKASNTDMQAELLELKTCNTDLAAEAAQAKRDLQAVQGELRDTQDYVSELEESLEAKEAELQAALYQKNAMKQQLEATHEKTVMKLRSDLEASFKKAKQIEGAKAAEVAFIQSQKNAQLELANSERKSLLAEVEVLRSASAMQSRENSAERKRFRSSFKENETPRSIHINICSPSDLHIDMSTGRRSSTRKNTVVQSLEDKDAIIAELRQELLKKDIELKLRQTSLFQSELVNMRAKVQANEQELIGIKTRSNSRRLDEDDSEEFMQVRNQVYALETELEHSRDELRKSFSSREKLIKEVKRCAEAEENAKRLVRQMSLVSESPLTTPRSRHEKPSTSESASKADIKGRRRQEGVRDRKAAEFAGLTKTVDQYKHLLGLDCLDSRSYDAQQAVKSRRSQLSSSEVEKEEVFKLRSKVLTLEHELLLERQRQELESKRQLTPYSVFNFQGSVDSSFKNLLLDL